MHTYLEYIIQFSNCIRCRQKSLNMSCLFPQSSNICCVHLPRAAYNYLHFCMATCKPKKQFTGTLRDHNQNHVWQFFFLANCSTLCNAISQRTYIYILSSKNSTCQISFHFVFIYRSNEWLTLCTFQLSFSHFSRLQITVRLAITTTMVT